MSGSRREFCRTTEYPRFQRIMSESATTNPPPAVAVPEKDEGDSREPQVDFGNGDDERDPEEVSPYRHHMGLGQDR